jgi:hypothetical protein
MRCGEMTIGFLCVLVFVSGLGCDDGAAPGGAADGGGATAGASATAGTSGGGAAGTGAAGTGAADAGGQLGPAAQVRVVNLVPGVTFDAWGPDADAVPTRLAEGLTYGTISDYFAAPLNRISQDPIFVLWKSGELPEEGKLFSTLQDNTHERVRIEMRELDAEGEHGTIVLSPMDDSADSSLQFTTLDEVETARGMPTKANLHVSFHLEPGALPGGVQPSVSIKGQSCLFNGSTSIALAHSVEPGSFELAVYDRQSSADCGETPELSTHALEVAAGDNELVVIYLDGGEITWLNAPLADL